MSPEILNGILYGLFTLLFGFGGAYVRGIKKKQDAQEARHKLEIDQVKSEAELRKKTQEDDARERQAIIDLLKAQVTVTTKMADNYREDADRRYAQEQERQLLINKFTEEQNKAVHAIGAVNTQLVAVSTGIEAATANTTAARQLTIELDKTIEGLSNDVERLTKTMKEGLDNLKNEVVTALDKVSRQPIAEEIRKTLLEAENRILERIDKLKTEEVRATSPITEVLPNVQTEIAP